MEFLFFWAVGAAYIGVIGIALVASVGSVVLLIWTLLDVIGAIFRSENDRLVWILIVLLTGLAGQLIWLLWGRTSDSVVARKGQMPRTFPTNGPATGPTNTQAPGSYPNR